MKALTFLIATLTVWCVGLLTSAEEEVEYAPYDGWFNNRIHPGLGGAETQLLRRLPTAYRDGTYEPAGRDRPNPIDLSDATMSGSTGFPSYQGRTALLVFFGQQVVEEILDAQRPGCPIEYFNIDIPKGHEKFDPHDEGDRFIPLLRSRFDQTTGYSPNNPRQQLNEISSFIDGTLMYGPNKAWTDALRSYHDGLLAATNDSDSDEGYFPAYNDIRLPMANPPPPFDHRLKPIKRFFKLGNPRGNENPFLLTFGVLWFRFHNFKARQIKVAHPDYNDEKLFLEARKWVIGIYQKIVMYDWLPQWLGNDTIPAYDKYDPAINPGIVQEFQSAAMRFGHTLVPPGVFRRNKRNQGCNFRMTTLTTGSEGHRAIRTCNSYWNPQDSVKESDIAEYLMGMASQITEREDNIITPDLRGDVFGPLEFSRRDLMAINIQRARDHGLPDYNTVRVEYGLERRTNWNDINPALAAEKPEVFRDLAALHNDDMSDIDLWVGGILETTPQGPGELFKAIIQNQFLRVRDGDRFWFENRQNHLFTDAELREIWSYRLKDVIMAVTDIEDEDIQDNPFFIDGVDPQCLQPVQLNGSNIDHLAPCSDLKHFDYFVGSEASYIASFVALGVFLLLTIATLILCANLGNRKQSKKKAISRRSTAKARGQSTVMTIIPAVEWVGKKEGDRDVYVKFDEQKLRVLLASKQGSTLRVINLINLTKGQGARNLIKFVNTDRRRPMVLVKVPREYDMVLRFDDFEQRDDFISKLDQMTQRAGLPVLEAGLLKEGALKKQTVTKAQRTQLLEKFVRVTFAHAFHYQNASDEFDRLNPQDAQDILGIQLSAIEFGEVMGLKPDSVFVKSMFNLIDKDEDGYISFRQYVDLMTVFSKGSAKDKARLMFDMYDVDKSGRMRKEEFKAMMISFVELANDNLDDAKADELVNSLFNKMPSYQEKESITFEDFSIILSDYEKELNYASLDWSGSDPQGPAPTRAPSRARRATVALSKIYNDRDLNEAGNQRMSLEETLAGKANSVPTKERTAPRTKWEKRRNAAVTWFEKNRLQLFWASLYTLVSIGIFMERAYFYSVEREHRGLRRMAGYGITVTRGAASGIMWTYSTLIVTMCRNTITRLRNTFLHRWIPFDSAVDMHKYIALHAFIFTCIHCVGHGINFYHISTQTANDLSCYFRDYFHATDELPKFHYWLFDTVTGFTGVVLVVILILMFVFAIQYARRTVYRAFWFTHNLYVLVYFFMILHGAGRLVQPPFFHFFFLGPLVLFTLDKLVSITRKKVEISVLKAELLPSDVTYIEFVKPNNFDYLSGQWARIASLSQSHNEYHPFTLTSAPHEETLSMHIRAVGPWTTNLRKVYDPNSLKSDPVKGTFTLPKIYLDGPYGEGHQDWYKYEVAVLIGGGIGVTPFASILKDLAYRSETGQRIKCKKVYFLWVTRTQKQFEWMTEIIRNVEDNDKKNIVSVHIFITQFKEKFDIRTTMLYICERHFQKYSDRSLLTGLRSITHFGRPDFASFFNELVVRHQKSSVFGVFSCGPPPLTSSVEAACTQVNRNTTNTLLVHHFENF